jgi:hypothetical protein
MPPEKEGLSRDEQLLKFFVQSCPQRLGRTQLVKLVYLADHEALRYLGSQISQFEWKREPRGPFTEKFYDVKNKLVDRELITEVEDVTPFGHPWYQYVDRDGPVKFDFTPSEERILRFIVQTYGGKSREELLQVVYDTKPFLEVEEKPRGTPIPMQMVSGERVSELGGVSLDAVIQGERRLRGGGGVFLSDLIQQLRQSTNSAAQLQS